MKAHETSVTMVTMTIQNFVCERNMENGEESGGCREVADVEPPAAAW